MNKDLLIEGINDKAFDLEVVNVNHTLYPTNRLEILTRMSADAWRSLLDVVPCFINRGSVPEAEAKMLEHYGANHGFTINLRPRAIFHEKSARSLAQDPTTAPNLLAWLARSDDIETRRFVVQNPNTSPAILYFLAEELPEDFMQNPIIGLLQIESPDLFEKLPSSLVKKLLGVSPLPSFVMSAALSHSSPNVRAHLAAVPQLNPLAIESLTQDNSPLVLSEVALRPDLTREQQQRLAAKPAAQPNLAKNLSLDPLLLRKLSNSYDTQVCVELAKNPKLPLELQRRLAGHKSIKVREALSQNEALHPEILRQLSSSPNERFKSIAARHPKTPIDCIEQLAAQTELIIRLQLAQNPSTPVAILKQFVAQGPATLSLTAAGNPNTPLDALSFLVESKSKKHRSVLAQRRDLSLSLFHMLITDTSYEVKLSLAANPSLPESCIKILSEDSRSYIRQQLVSNPGLSREMLYKMTKPSNGQRYEFAAIERVFSGMVPGVTLGKRG